MVNRTNSTPRLIYISQHDLDNRETKRLNIMLRDGLQL